jgi:hypothetical protein
VSRKYAVTITYPDGHVLRATVTKETLAGFRLSACKGCAVSIIKVQS